MTGYTYLWVTCVMCISSGRACGMHDFSENLTTFERGRFDATKIVDQIDAHRAAGNAVSYDGKEPLENWQLALRAVEETMNVAATVDYAKGFVQRMSEWLSEMKTTCVLSERVDDAN